MSAIQPVSLIGKFVAKGGSGFFSRHFSPSFGG
jgi:hypothetical protein